MTPDIDLREVTVRYRDVAALDGLTLHLAGGRIHGLLGRNGSGKTTLASLVAAFRRPTSGVVTIGGAVPYENPDVTRRVCLIHEASTSGEDLGSLGDVMRMAALLRPTWDQDLADRLVDRFELPRGTKVGRLSRGQRSAVGVVVGLASRAPVTIFDEAHLGMDAPARAVFAEELLDDYLTHPRTILLSTHLVDEAAHLFEDVVVLDRGRVLLQDGVESLRHRGATVTGPADEVERFVAGHRVLASRRLGGTARVTIDGQLTDRDRLGAGADHLEVAPVGLQDLFVGLTTTAGEGRP